MQVKWESHIHVCTVSISKICFFTTFYLFEFGHASDLRVELRHLLLVESLGHLDEGSPLVGAALLVPVGPRGLELGGAHDVDAAGLAQEEVLEGVWDYCWSKYCQGLDFY